MLQMYQTSECREQINWLKTEYWKAMDQNRTLGKLPT